VPLSPDMKLGGDSMTTVQDFLFELMNVEELESSEWELRRSQQHRIGRDLYRAVFAPDGLGDPERWIHIIPERHPLSNDQTEFQEFVDFICRVPWTLLTADDTSNAPFIVLDEIEPVAITIDGAPDRGNREWFLDVKLPPYPRLLLVIPEVREDPPTEGAAHRNELEEALAEHYARAGVPHYLQIVSTFDAFRKIIRSKALDPHILYFYGHGATEGGHGTSFQFQNADGSADWRSFDEIRQELDGLVQRTNFPPLIWINACHGASAEQDSGLRALAPISCCVVTTRTLVAVRDSRSLATNTLPKIVIEGCAPHSAIRETLHETPLPVKSARWATTVIAVQYETWSALGSEDRIDVDLDSAGDFPMRMDRRAPLQNIFTYLKSSLESPPEGPQSIIWYGPSEQGLDVFEERIAELVIERFQNWRVFPRRVELQSHLLPRSVRDRAAYFRAGVFSALRGMPPRTAGRVDFERIRSAFDNLSGNKNVFVLLHGPLEQEDLSVVRDYVDFWQKLFYELMLPGRDVRIVLGFYFSGLSATLEAIQLDGTLVQALGPVPPRELADHMNSYRYFYSLTQSEVPQAAQSLVEAHGGRFNHIRLALEELAGFINARPERP
jgi:hypothetical protein